MIHIITDLTHIIVEGFDKEDNRMISYKRSVTYSVATVKRTYRADSNSKYWPLFTEALSIYFPSHVMNLNSYDEYERGILLLDSAVNILDILKGYNTDVFQCSFCPVSCIKGEISMFISGIQSFSKIIIMLTRLSLKLVLMNMLGKSIPLWTQENIFNIL